MPAPTALLRTPEKLAEEVAPSFPAKHVVAIEQPKQITAGSEDAIPSAVTRASQVSGPAETPSDTAMQIDTDAAPHFAPEPATKLVHKAEARKVMVPQHRMSPLKGAWPKIYPPLVEHLKLQVRMLPHKRTIEMRTSKHTTDSGALQKGEDFVKAFCLGFEVDDAIALLRLDDLYIETFECKDVKMLGGEHLSRAIGRIAGKDGKTKFAIENASKTRISLEGQTVHILGGFKNIHIAREAVVSLILGSPPSKVYGNLRIVSARMFVLYVPTRDAFANSTFAGRNDFDRHLASHKHSVEHGQAGRRHILNVDVHMNKDSLGVACKY